jgi:hypothetical protein
MKQVSPFKLLANRLIRLPLRQARDLFECCRYQARWLAPLPNRPLLAPFESLEPYFHPQPWSSALTGRRVLEVHPFARSIASQFRQRRGRTLIIYTN